MARIFGLQKNVFFLGVTSFLNDLSSEMVLSVLPAFFISVLKTGAGALGFVEGAADAMANLIKIYSGKHSDKLSQRKIFTVIGYVVSVSTRPFYSFAGSVAHVGFLRVTDRFGKGLRDSPRDALISLSVDKSEIGWSFGYHRAMDTLGGVLGPLIAYLILAAYPGSFSSVFMVSFVIGLLAVFSLLWVKDVSALMERKVHHGGQVLSPRIRDYIISLFILSIGTLPVAVVLFKTVELGFPIETIPLFYMAYSLSFSMFSWPAGRMIDVIGSGRVIVTGYLMLIVAYALISIATNHYMLIVGLVILGIFSACTDGAQRSHISKHVGVDHRGVAFGYLYTAIGFGALIGGVMGGYIWEQWGSSAALVMEVCITCFGLVAFMYALRTHHREKHSV
ncbi:MAG: MFS transporter [Candidatus Pacebacteria bacterium]|nr:MFS transporter [Candidatus Paceibacterota bacterium]